MAPRLLQFLERESSRGSGEYHGRVAPAFRGRLIFKILRVSASRENLCYFDLGRCVCVLVANVFLGFSMGPRGFQGFRVLIFLRSHSRNAARAT